MAGDEAIRQRVMDNGGPAAGQRRLVELGHAEALALLAGIAYGRVVFTQDSLPAIRPVNHLIDQGRIILRTRLSAKISHALQNLAPTPTVVAYEADQIDPVERLGWSVVATGFIRAIHDKTEVARLQAALTPWVDMNMDTVMAITPEIITGFRLTPAE